MFYKVYKYNNLNTSLDSLLPSAFYYFWAISTINHKIPREVWFWFILCKFWSQIWIPPRDVQFPPESIFHNVRNSSMQIFSTAHTNIENGTEFQEFLMPCVTLYCDNIYSVKALVCQCLYKYRSLHKDVSGKVWLVCQVLHNAHQHSHL